MKILAINNFSLAFTVKHILVVTVLAFAFAVLNLWC